MTQNIRHMICTAMQCRENVEPGIFTDGSMVYRRKSCIIGRFISQKRLGSWWMQTWFPICQSNSETLTEYEVASNVSI
ncbi:hypothetical protein OUZ56_028133 [Daphnia magna]|uniref:Uncharacterized protein n=1 Tax=Daphnia magna TaxID=35525 RepID=A0ABR0B3K4_9CRUS|nr:hypothetical protein OUZ56_028133 [Daphnia magna]